MKMKLKSFKELNNEAFNILSQEIGIVDTLRFFGQLWSGTGDYTVERRELFKSLTMEEYRNAVKNKGKKTK